MIKSMTKKTNNKKGFTLIELIVVIAILGILAAIAIPRLGGVQGTANQKATVANLKMINNSIEIYAANNNVATTTVTKDLLNTGDIIVTANWPAGPTSIVYSIDAGVAVAAVPANTKGFTTTGNLVLSGDSLIAKP